MAMETLLAVEQHSLRWSGAYLYQKQSIVLLTKIKEENLD